MLVAVVGATGNQGSTVAAGLAGRGYEIRALVRDASKPKAQELKAKNADKIELVVATLEDVASLIKAFEGVDAIYAYTAGGPGELVQGKNIADAAAAAKAGLLIWSTAVNITEVTDGKIKDCDMMDNKARVDEYIKQLGINHVLIRCGDFYENFLRFDLVKYDKESDQINIVMAGYTPDTVSKGVCISYDLDKVVDLVLSNPSRFKPGSSDKPSAYFSKTEKENDYVHFACDHSSFGELGSILEKKTGKKVNLITTEPFFPDLGRLIQYIQEYGGWGKGGPVTDPKLTDLGFKPTKFEEYVTREIIPAIGLAVIQEGMDAIPHILNEGCKK